MGATSRVARLSKPLPNPSLAKDRSLYQEVAELHVACINQGFLSTLGVGFLALMYEAIDLGRDSVLIVYQEGGRVVGFVAGASAMGPIFRRMLRSWAKLSLALLPSIWSPRRIWRIIEICRYSFRGHSTPELPAAELLAIAVEPSCRGKGLAAKLYLNLSSNFKSKGLTEFKVIVGVSLAPAHGFYKRMGAVAISEIEVHGGSLSIAYIQDLSEPR